MREVSSGLSAAAVPPQDRRPLAVSFLVAAFPADRLDGLSPIIMATSPLDWRDDAVGNLLSLCQPWLPYVLPICDLEGHILEVRYMLQRTGLFFKPPVRLDRNHYRGIQVHKLQSTVSPEKGTDEVLVPVHWSATIKENEGFLISL